VLAYLEPRDLMLNLPEIDRALHLARADSPRYQASAEHPENPEIMNTKRDLMSW